MKKAMLITLYGEYNYGNRLQNYAVSEYLKKYEIETTTVKNNAILNRNDKYILRYLKYCIIKLKSKIKRKTKYEKERIANFRKFNKNINISTEMFNFFRIKKYKNYDYYIVGSDQIWNYNFGCLRKFDLAEFTDSNNKISFSASFGVDKIPDEYKEYTKECLKKFKAISVREESGKKIVEELTRRKDVEVLIDPTMLLTNKEWEKVIRKPKGIEKKKFILNYFLGDLSDERIKKIKKVAEENQCEIINILDINSKFYECGPSEFLWLEKNAFIVCTDSFHSSVFSILFNVPFIIFKRKDKNISMNSRIDTLLKTFKLEDRYYDGKISKEMLECNYTESYEILEKARKKAKDFIEKNI